MEYLDGALEDEDRSWHSTCRMLSYDAFKGFVGYARFPEPDSFERLVDIARNAYTTFMGQEADFYSMNIRRAEHHLASLFQAEVASVFGQGYFDALTHWKRTYIAPSCMPFREVNRETHFLIDLAHMIEDGRSGLEDCGLHVLDAIDRFQYYPWELEGHIINIGDMNFSLWDRKLYNFHTYDNGDSNIVETDIRNLMDMRGIENIWLELNHALPKEAVQRINIELRAILNGPEPWNLFYQQDSRAPILERPKPRIR